MDQSVNQPGSSSATPLTSTPNVTTASVTVNLKTKRRRSFIIFTVLSIIFWGLEYLVQIYRYSLGDSASALVRSFAFTGMTLFSLSLFISTIFKWFPKTAKFWRWRRWLGVSASVFVTFHILAVLGLFFNFNLTYLYFSFNPWVNLIIPGTLAYIILLVMASISTDTMISKVKPKKWKFIHRFVYLAFIAAMLHFFFVHPAAIKNAPGYFLTLIVFVTVVSQIYWFLRIAARKKFMSLGALVGFGLIALTIISFWLTNRAQQ